MARFCPLFSSSGGNSIYIGVAEDGILIDAGVSAKQLEQALWKIGVEPDSLRGIFITHEHTDHIKGLKVFTKKHNLRLYMTEGTYEALTKTDALDNARECIIMPKEGIEIGYMHIENFPTMHDAAQSCGYRVEVANGRKMAVATDLGVVTDEVMNAVTGCDLVMLESNHDVNMLQCGPYPYALKRRILGTKGHLSNDACALTASQLLKTGTTHFVLGHLSRENNIPQLAHQASSLALEQQGAREGDDYILRVAEPVWDKGAIVI